MIKKISLLVLSLTLLTACSLPGLGGSVKGNDIIIASGNTSERQILTQIIAQMIEREMPDVDVEIINNLGSSVLIFQAIMGENANMGSAMYTGTSLLGELGMEPILDANETFEAVVEGYYKRFDTTWFPSYGFENTYAFMVRKDFAAKHNLKTVTDLEVLAPDLKVGIDPGWIDRQLDGYENFKINYDFEFGNVYPMEIGLVYSALESEQLQVSLGYSTDGRIDAFDLVVLEDDKGHFPSYAVSPVVSNALLEQYPQLQSILLKLEDAISLEKMQAMNRASDELNIEPALVAKQFLIDNDYFSDVEDRLLSDIPLYSKLQKGGQ